MLGVSLKTVPSADFDQRLTMIQSYQMLAVLEQVRDRGLSGTCWDVLCGSKDYGVRRDCYLKLLGQTLTDAPVRRSDKVLGTGTRPTFGGASVVYCETDVSILCHSLLYLCLHGNLHCTQGAKHFLDQSACR